MQLFLKLIILFSLTLLLNACNGFFDKDNTPPPTPLTKIQPEIKPTLAWNKSVNFGMGRDYLKLTPAVTHQSVFTADYAGLVTASDKTTGSILWKTRTHVYLSAGPVADNDLLFVVSRKGRIIALRQLDGCEVWQASASSEILAPPAARNGVVLIKSIDGQLTAYSQQDGHRLWTYKQSEPALILRGGSAPKITDNASVTGFANGSVSKLTLNNGSLLWDETIAIPEGTFAIQRMVDIDADPVIHKDRVYVATYQGRISALHLSTGKSIWSHDISSFTGLAVDDARVYVSDAKSNIWAFDAGTGHVDWRQTDLEHRKVTGPAGIDNFIVVGDAEGYLHWLDKQDGHFVARNRVKGFGVIATPVVSDNHVFVLTKEGRLASYSLG